MNDAVTRRNLQEKGGSTTSTRIGDYTGILPSQKIQEMMDNGEIKPWLKQFEADQVQPASIDLRLGDYAYPVDTSFLPGKGMRLLDKMKQLDEQFSDFKIDLSKRAVLDQGRIVNLHDRAQKVRSMKTALLTFTVDLEGLGAQDGLVGYRAKKHATRIDLERRNYDPLDFWEPIRFRKTSSLILDPDEFYILVTKEAIAVPPEYAAEMLPYDTRAGEFRVHYAGFFHPAFGWA